jgi:prepilin-type N-terminal cleavage/methylation domain-containing protein
MFKLSKLTNNKQGFTLVELLVVIAIITILAGAVFMIINPVQLNRKASETHMKGKTSQLCEALFACGSRYDSALNCGGGTTVDPFEQIGVVEPREPQGAAYSITPSNGLPSAEVTIFGTLTTGSNTCIYDCSLNFETGNIRNLTKGANCI